MGERNQELFKRLLTVNRPQFNDFYQSNELSTRVAELNFRNTPKNPGY